MLSGTSSLTGLLLTITLMFGQFGLLAASADDRDRDGDFVSDTDVISTDDDSGSSGSGSGGTGGGPTIQTRDDSNVKPRATTATASVALRLRAQDPGTYDHSTGIGGTLADANETELNAEDFSCNDKVTYWVRLTRDNDALPATTTVTFNMSFAKTTTSNQPFGFSAGSGIALANTSEALDTGDGDEVLGGTGFGSTSTHVTANVTVSNIEPNEVRYVRITVVLGNCGPGDANGNVHASLQGDHSATGGVNTSGGSQTVVLKLAGLPSIELEKDIIPSSDPGVFDLQLNGTTRLEDAEDGDSVELAVFPGTYTIGEIAGNGSTDLANYVITVECTESGEDLEFTGPGPHTVTVDNVNDGGGDDGGDDHRLLASTIGPLDDDGGGSGADEWKCVFTNKRVKTDLTIVKTASVQSIGFGQPFTYKVVVTNTGPVDANNVVVVDNLDDGFTGVSATFDISPAAGGDTPCTVAAGNVVTCNVGTLQKSDGNTTSTENDVVEVVISVTAPNTCGIISNRATVSWNDLTPNQNVVNTKSSDPSGTNPTNVTVTGCQPSLAITKVANVQNGEVSENTSFTYTVTVANSGAGEATGVVITDTLPASLNTLSATFSVDGGASQNCTFIGNAMTCTVGTLPAGKSVVVTITATAPRTCPQISNTATVDSDQTSPQNSTASVVTVVDCGVAISKTASPTPPDDAAPLGTVTFTIMAENQEFGSVTGVVITDVLPAGFTFVSSTPDASGSPSTPPFCTNSSGTVTCTIGTLAGNDGTTGSGPDFIAVTITATTPDECGSFGNTATIDWDQNPSQDPKSSNTATVDVEGCAPDMSLVKAGDTTVAANGQATWTVTVSNDGNADATNVQVTDTLPSGFVFDSSTPDATGSPSTPPFCTHSSGTVSCSLGTIAPDGEVVVTIKATAPDECGEVTNSASGTFGTGQEITKGTQSVGVTVTDCAPDLSIDKTGDATVAADGNITWTIAVSNDGNANATNVKITDTLPTGFTFVSSTPDATGSPSTPPFCTHSSGTVSCSLGTIAADGDATITITATAPDECGDFVNKASGTFGPNDTPIPQDDAEARGSVTGCEPDVTLDKSGPNQVSLGGSITYTVTVTNNGNADAFGVVVNDTLPAPLTNAQASASQGSCQAALNIVSCSIGTLTPGQDETITITADVPENAECVSINNQATGSFGGEIILDSLTRQTVTTIPPSGTVTTEITGCGPPPPPPTFELTVFKSVADAIVEPGQPISFTITVQNTGNQEALLVTLDDTIPAVPGVTWSITTQPASGTCSLVVNTLHCDLGNMAPGASLSVTVTSTNTSSASCGTFTNVAVADAQNTPSDSAQVGVEVDCPDGIDIVKNGPATAYEGDTITYTFDVTLASGSDPLGNVQLTDPRCDAGTLTGPTGDTNGNGLLDAGETWHYSCTHVVTESDPDPLPNTATVCSGTVCDSDDHVVEILKPAIEIVKNADPDSGGPGEVITYTYTVTNTGDVTLFDITVDDDVLGHICDIPELQPGKSKKCTGTFTIPNNANVEITNVAVAVGEDENGTEVSDEDTETVGVVRGTTVTPTTTPPTTTPPGGVAFTGSGAVVPMVMLALLMLTLGTGLLWWGRRRGTHARSMFGR